MNTFMDYVRRQAQIERVMEGARRGDWRDRLNACRKVYALAAPDMADGYLPYVADIPMTPIERSVWLDLRSRYLPFYVQFPVGRFVVDFADPVRRIAIECDGAAYHDEERDRGRDAELLAMGWEVIRIEGWRCMRDEEDAESSAAIVRELARRYA